MRLRLTENVFRNMLTEMVKDVLNEAKMSLDDIYNKYYSNIDKNIFLAAVNADPTSKRTEDGNIVGIGDYTKWILNLAKQKKWKPGDSVETKDLLSKFNKHQKDLPVEQRDINRYTSISELYNTLKPYLGIKSRSERKSGAEKVYEDNEWLIIIPHTEEAACYYGANTKWCTAAMKGNMFDYYNGKGLLYINVYKPRNEKYQFHFEERQFMDEEDKPIQPNTLPWTEGALAYYKSINKDVYFRYDRVGKFDSNGIAIVYLKGKINLFSLEKQGLLSPNLWFDKVESFYNGIAVVTLNRKQTWFSLEKQGLLSPNLWFDYVYEFVEGIARVELNGKETWFSLEKQDYLFPNQWFDRIDYFYKGIAVVTLNGKFTWFSSEEQGLLFPNKWFDWVGNFKNGIARVELNGKYTWFSLEKQDYLFPNLWFDKVDFFYNGIARVELNGEWYNFTLDGQLLDFATKEPLSQEQVQNLFQQQQQIAEMANRLVRNYRKY